MGTFPAGFPVRRQDGGAARRRRSRGSVTLSAAVATGRDPPQQAARRFLFPDADGIFPQRGRRSPLTEGLGSPHEGFGFPSRRAGVLFISTETQRRHGENVANVEMWKCGNVANANVANYQLELDIGTGYWQHWQHSQPSLYAAAFFPAGVGVLPCTGVWVPLYGRQGVSLSTDKMSVVPVCRQDGGFPRLPFPPRGAQVRRWNSW